MLNLVKWKSPASRNQDWQGPDSGLGPGSPCLLISHIGTSHPVRRPGLATPRPRTPPSSDCAGEPTSSHLQEKVTDAKNKNTNPEGRQGGSKDDMRPNRPF